MVPLRVPEPPTRFAVSLIDPPGVAVGVAAVVRIGVAWLTTLVSPGSLQAVAGTAMRLSSRYVAISRYVPGWLSMNGIEVAVPVPPVAVTTALVLVTIAALPHVASFGP